MQPVLSLPQPYPSLRLRLQAPALTAGRETVPAQGQLQDGQIAWEAQAGAVLLRGLCRPEGEKRWRLEFRLENRGAAAEVRLALPYLFYHFDQDQPARLFNPLFGGVLEASTVPLRIAYPGPASFCLTAAAGLACSVAVGLYNEEQRQVIIRHIPAGVDGQIRLVFERVWLHPQEELALPAQFIAVGEDWAEALCPYRDWFQAAFRRPRPRPAWWVGQPFSETRRAHCLAPCHPPEAAAGVWIFDNEGRPRTFAQVKAEVDEAARQGAAEGWLPLFYQFGWWQNMAEIQGLFMFDSLCGDYTEAHALAKETVAYIHQQGLRTYFYTNAISAGDESAVYRLHPELFARDARGFPVYNMDYPMLMFCPGAPRIRDHWDRVLDYLFLSLGVDGLFLDQVCGGAPPVYCYAPDHQHAHPDTYGRDFLDLIDYIARRARRLKPDCYVGGELVQDTRAILLDEAHGYGYSGPRRPPPQAVEAQRRTQPSEYYIFTRYLCPEIYSQKGGGALPLMNGAAGHHAEALWREHRAVFESTCTPCRVEPCGGLAYLFGPQDGRAILAVRAHGEIGRVAVHLPEGFYWEGALPAGLERQAEGCVACPAGTAPAFYIFSTPQEAQ